jgi:hypothetical protein
MTFSVNREGGDSDMTSNKTEHPLPHPAGRASKQGFQIRHSKFFKNNYYMEEYECTPYGHNESQEINFLIKNEFWKPCSATCQTNPSESVW